MSFCCIHLITWHERENCSRTKQKRELCEQKKADLKLWLYADETSTFVPKFCYRQITQFSIDAKCTDRERFNYAWNRMFPIKLKIHKSHNLFPVSLQPAQHSTLITYSIPSIETLMAAWVLRWVSKLPVEKGIIL